MNIGAVAQGEPNRLSSSSSSPSHDSLKHSAQQAAVSPSNDVQTSSEGTGIQVEEKQQVTGCRPVQTVSAQCYDS